MPENLLQGYQCVFISFQRWKGEGHRPKFVLIQTSCLESAAKVHRVLASPWTVGTQKGSGILVCCINAILLQCV